MDIDRDRKRGPIGRHVAAGLGTATAALVLLVASAAPASAHPLGNFSTNVFSGLRVQPEQVLVDYVVDLAEIPTVRAGRDVTRLGQQAWAAGECRRLAAGVQVHEGSRAVSTAVRSSAMAYGEGAGGLSVLRLTCEMVAPRLSGSGRTVLRWEDANFSGQVGWREVTAIGDGTTLAASDVPDNSVSHRLTRYPDDQLRSPLRITSARLEIVPGGSRVAGTGDDTAVGRIARPLAGDQLTARFTALVARGHLDAPFVLLALGLAMLLGAAHAFGPGHGKTVMAAYLVGQRGTLRQALVIGAAVTATHTFGVLVLGLLLSVSSILAPERLFSWLTVASGVLFALIGVRLLAGIVRQHRAARTARTHDHPYDHGHQHTDGHVHGDSHHGHAHPHDEGHSDEHAHGGLVHRHPVPDPGGAAIGWRSLLVLGLAGGMVPTPSALIVLLGAIALGRVWLGVVLVLAYGAGMAAALSGAGLLLVRARGLFEARAARWRRSVPLAIAGRLLPVCTASLIVLAGAAVVARGAAAL